MAEPPRQARADPPPQRLIEAPPPPELPSSRRCTVGEDAFAPRLRAKRHPKSLWRSALANGAAPAWR
eukprot:15470774-Alexandrium_andersonii.AAC.1